MLRLIRSYLTAGALDNGLFEDSREGTPQGGPLSPLLSNLVLDELDRELKRRGHRFVRYADDCNIYVRSETRRAGELMDDRLTRFIERRLQDYLQLSTQRRVRVAPTVGIVGSYPWLHCEERTGVPYDASPKRPSSGSNTGCAG